MPPKKNNSPTFRDLRDTLDMAREQLQTKEDVVKSYLSSTLGVDIADIEKLYGKYTIDEINLITEDEKIEEIYESIKKENTDDALKNLETDREESRIELKKQLITEALKEYEEILSDRSRLDDIEQEYTDALEEHAAYISSEQYDADIESRIESMRGDVVALQEKIVNSVSESEQYNDKKKLKKYNRDIQVATQRYTLEYLYERVDDPENGEAEKARIVENFFNKQRSAYIMKRYRAKCGQFGMPADAIYSMMHLEEKFLEPEFHVYNNFYLFFVINKIAYADVDEITEVKQPMQNITNLVYNKFPVEKGREAFLDSVRGFLQRFADYRVMFSEKNITHPQHPVRIEKDEDRRLKKKARLLSEITKEDPNLAKSKNLDKLGIDELEYMLAEIKKAKADPSSIVVETEAEESVTSSSIAQVKVRRVVQVEDQINLSDSVARGGTTPIIYREATPEEVSELESVETPSSEESAEE